MEAGKERLARDTMRDTTRAEVDGLKRENERIKQLVAELSLKVYLLKKTDIWVIEQGNISITPLHTNLLNRSTPPILDSLCSDLFHELQKCADSVTTRMK